MIRPALCAFLPVLCLAAAGCRTGSGDGAETKDAVAPNAQVTRHYYAVGEEARRALCPFGIDVENSEAYRAQCDVPRKLALEAFTENLERAYGERFKNGEALSAEESALAATFVQGLADSGALNARDGSDAESVVLARFAAVIEQAFGIAAETPPEESLGAAADDRGSQVLTASFGTAPGISVTPLIVSQSPVVASGVTVRLNGCKGKVLGLATAEAPGQPARQMDVAGDGDFRTKPGAARRMALIQVAISSAGGFCQVKVTSSGTPAKDAPAQVTTDGAELGPEAQVGVLQYNGGFVPQLVAPLNPPQLVRQFRVAVPSGCDADVVKGGILTTQEVAPTTLLDAAQRIFRVNGGAGTVASGVSVSLNGPLGFCQIPIFVR